MADWVNQGWRERILRVAVGGLLLGLGLRGGGDLTGLWLVVGTALLATGLSGFCLTYRVLGINRRTQPHRS